MATQHSFEGKIITIPGAYSTVKSGIRNPILASEFGNTLVILTKSGKFFGGGAGINGTLQSGVDSLYAFDNSGDARNFFRGGLWWLLTGPMFSPGGGAGQGISSLTVAKAQTTVPAEITLEFGDQSDDSDGDGADNNSSITVQVKEEGYSGNGVLGNETRATSTVTITNAGSAGDEIAIQFDNEILAVYTVESGDGIADVVAGLVASLAEIGLSDLVSSNTTQLTIRAPRGYAAVANGLSNTINSTGSVAGTSGFYSGGVEGTLLTRGYAAKVIAGQLDPDKYIVQFWRGTFKGLDTDVRISGAAKAFDGLAELSTKPELVVQSPEVDTVQELVDWMDDEAGDGYSFNLFFKRKEHSIASITDEIVEDDITGLWVKAGGGTESTSINDVLDVLEAIEDLTFDFIICDDFGTNVRSANNLAIQSWINTTAKIKPDMYVAAGSTVGEYNTGAPTCSVEVAKAYNDMNVTVVHGGVWLTDVGGLNFKQYKSIYKAADMLGREAGMEPQIPLTFKGLGIQGEAHILSTKEQKIALNSGVLVSKPVGGSFDVLKGINSLQNNKFLVNPDGTTHSKQLSRIIRQINKELVNNIYQSLLKKQDGPNRNTVSTEDVKEFVKGFLQARCATNTDDNILITFRNVEVTRSQDAYNVTYVFEGNLEISFVFVVGVLVDAI